MRPPPSLFRGDGLFLSSLGRNRGGWSRWNKNTMDNVNSRSIRDVRIPNHLSSPVEVTRLSNLDQLFPHLLSLSDHAKLCITMPREPLEFPRQVLPMKPPHVQMDCYNAEKLVFIPGAHPSRKFRLMGLVSSSKFIKSPFGKTSRSSASRNGWKKCWGWTCSP